MEKESFLLISAKLLGDKLRAWVHFLSLLLVSTVLALATPLQTCWFSTLPWSAYWLGWFLFQGTIFPQRWGFISPFALCNNSPITALCNAKQTFLTPLLNLTYYSIHKNYVAHTKAGQLPHRAFVDAPKALQNLFSVVSKSCMYKQCCRQELSEGRAEGCTETHLPLNQPSENFTYTMGEVYRVAPIAVVWHLQTLDFPILHETNLSRECLLSNQYSTKRSALCFPPETEWISHRQRGLTVPSAAQGRHSQQLREFPSKAFVHVSILL